MMMTAKTLETPSILPVTESGTVRCPATVPRLLIGVIRQSML
jgi:hypothetical protein